MPGFELGQTDQRHRVLGLLCPSALLHLSELRLPARQGDTLFVRIWVLSASARLLFFSCLSLDYLLGTRTIHLMVQICVFAISHCLVTFLYLSGYLSVPGWLTFCTWQVAFLYLSDCLSICVRLPFCTRQVAFLYLSACLSAPGCLMSGCFLHLSCCLFTPVWLSFYMSGCISTSARLPFCPCHLSSIVVFALMTLFIDLLFNFRTQITDSFFFTCISCIWEPQTKNQVPTARK